MPSSRTSSNGGRRHRCAAATLIVRDVPPTALADLAVAAPPAALAAAVDDEIRVWPVDISLDDPVAISSSPRAVRLPDGAPNLESVLSAARVMILATRSATGTPFVTPLWFVPHRGLIWATTAATSWVVRNLASTAEVAALFGGEGGQGLDQSLTRVSSARTPSLPSAATGRSGC